MGLGHLTRGLNQELFTLSGISVTPVSVALLLATLVVSGILGALARRAITRAFAVRNPTSEGLGYAIGRISQYSIVALGLVVGLSNVGIDLTALTAAGALLTVGIGFGLHSIAQNFMSGLVLLIERPVQRGDFVVVGDTVGTVTEISMRATRIMSRDGIAIIVPNSELVNGRVVNQSAPTGVCRVRVRVHVAVGSDTELVRQTLLAVATGHADVLATPAPEVFFTDFAQGAYDFELAVWLRDPQPQPRVTSDLRFAIDRAFREQGIRIPLPQRDLHLAGGFERLTPRPAASVEVAPTPAERS